MKPIVCQQCGQMKIVNMKPMDYTFYEWGDYIEHIPIVHRDAEMLSIRFLEEE